MDHTPLRMLVAFVLSVSVARSIEAATPAVMFERDVRPILKTHCFHCHGEGEVREGELDLRLRRLMVEGGGSGPAIAPGDPEDSYLLDRIRSGDMPPGEGTHLTGGEIATIESWVAAGAPTARAEPKQLGPELRITEEERSFWAFQPIRRPEVPPVQPEERMRNAIDAFLLARLEPQGLGLSPEADRPALVRRATFDLLGLPPTPEEVEAFVTDQRPDAYERLLDRLLASPRYGERWGRHWLDVAGYADSEGYNEADTVREHAFRYRDYVIAAMNDDKPFDAFLREQLAGDEMVAPPYRNLSPAETQRLTATGFLRMAPDGTGSRNDDPVLARHAVLAETVKIVSSSLLGLTVACAQCHDHRFDPILQRDYYRLRAVFEPAFDPANWRPPRRRQISMLSDAEREQARQFEAKAKAIEAELEAKFKEFQAWVFEQELEQVPVEVREEARVAGLAWQADPKKLTDAQKTLLQDYPSLKVAATQQRLNLFLGKYGRQEELREAVEENQQRAQAVREGKPQERFIRALTETPGNVPVTHLFIRGDHTNPGEAIGPSDLTVLGGEADDFPQDDPSLPTTGRRLALARRLTDDRHPLVARVLANRFWMHHFGRGIVNTPGDFGLQGERPTHPQLLDWLARELLESGWSLKRLHKTIMSSAAYRQASVRHAEGERIDAENALYWRMPVRRLEAESVRDAILAVSGQLNPLMGGPPVPVSLDKAGQPVVGDGDDAADPEELRRSVYVQVRRSTPAYLLSAFDAPAMEPNCTARNASTVAPQSLLMMNNAFILQQAERFATRVRREAGGAAEDQVRRAWQLAFAAPPAEADVAEMLRYLQSQTDLLASGRTQPEKQKAAELEALASLCQVLLGSNRFLYVD